MMVVRGAILLGFVVLVGGLVFLLIGSISDSGDNLVAEVRRGEFVVEVRAEAKLEAADAESVESQPRGKALIYLAPEGKRVTKGELLARFDDTQLRERVLEQQNDLLMAQARLEEKRQQMAVQRQQNAATVTLRNADLAIKRTQYERMKALPLAVDLARARLERDYRESRLKIAEQDLLTIRELNERGSRIFSKEEMREKELAHDEAKGEREKAENLLKQVQAGATEAELDATRRDLTKAEIDLREAERAEPLKERILEAAVKAADAEVEKMRVRLERTSRDLDRLEVKSPAEGFLVYRTIHGRPLELGTQFWHNAKLFDIADLRRMNVRAKVSESEFSKIKVGQPAEIRVFAVPGRVFSGKVIEVAKMAEDKSVGQLISRHHQDAVAGIQAFDVVVNIDQDETNLRPNMEAEVLIRCDRVEDALSVPIDAVFRETGRDLVHVTRGGRREVREVTLGVRGRDRVQIADGLEAGETVQMNPQSGKAE